MNKYDIIASVIGRSNVGKSLLFNRLINNNNSLISDIPGTTVDIKCDSIIFKKKIIEFIDTAAIDYPDKYIYKKVFDKILYSIEKSNIILFTIDSSNIFLNKDIYFLKYLLSFKKKILLIFNKIDIKSNIKNISNFNFINKNDMIYVSSLYNKGIKLIINKIFDNFNENINIDDNYKVINFNKNKYIRLSILGKQNVGKTTLINSITNNKILITSSKPGTTSDSTDSFINFNNNNFVFTDTAGIKNHNFLYKKNKNTSSYSNKLNNIIIKNINKSNIVIFLIDITLNITNNDLYIINYLVKLGKPIILLFNKCDLLNNNIIGFKKKYILNKLKFVNFINIIFISALYKQNIKLIIKSINKINLDYNKKIKTNFLNKILKESIKNLNHRYVNNEKPKLKFCKLYNNNPIKIIIFGKKIYLLDNCYKKYITNCFYKNLNYNNIPINIIYKEFNK